MTTCLAVIIFFATPLLVHGASLSQQLPIRAEADLACRWLDIAAWLLAPMVAVIGGRYEFAKERDTLENTLAFTMAFLPSEFHQRDLREIVTELCDEANDREALWKKYDAIDCKALGPVSVYRWSQIYASRWRGWKVFSIARSTPTSFQGNGDALGFYIVETKHRLKNLIDWDGGRIWFSQGFLDNPQHLLGPIGTAKNAEQKEGP